MKLFIKEGIKLSLIIFISSILLFISCITIEDETDTIIYEYVIFQGDTILIKYAYQ